MMKHEECGVGVANKDMWANGSAGHMERGLACHGGLCTALCPCQLPRVGGAP